MRWEFFGIGGRGLHLNFRSCVVHVGFATLDGPAKHPAMETKMKRQTLIAGLATAAGLTLLGGCACLMTIMTAAMPVTPITAGITTPPITARIITVPAITAPAIMGMPMCRAATMVAAIAAIAMMATIATSIAATMTLAAMMLTVAVLAAMSAATSRSRMSRRHRSSPRPVGMAGAMGLPSPAGISPAGLNPAAISPEAFRPVVRNPQARRLATGPAVVPPAASDIPARRTIRFKQHGD